MLGHPTAGIFGYSHLTGGFAGGQAEYARVPFADVGPLKIENGLTDEQVLFLSDILPTGYMGAEMCDIKPGDVVAVWGAGPVGQFAIASARLLGAERGHRHRPVPVPAARWRARRPGADDDQLRGGRRALDALKELTGGRGPDACIDAVGMEAHATAAAGLRLRPGQAGDARSRPTGPIALREAIMSCRNGGTVSVIGVYGGLHRQVPDRRR